MNQEKQPKPRTLNRAKVVNAAFDVLDEKGMSGLTLKVLAERLDVQAPALYKHFDNKDALYVAMAQYMFDAWTNAVTQQENASWRDLLTHYAVECRSLLLHHREGARLFAAYHPYVQSDFSAYMLIALRKQGFPAKDAVYALSTLLSFVVGFALEEDFDKHAAPATSKSLNGQDVPAEFLEYTSNPEEEFTYGVDCIISGIAMRVSRD